MSTVERQEDAVGGIERLAGKVWDGAVETVIEIAAGYDKRYPAVLNVGIATTLATIAVGAETAALHLSDRPRTVANSVAVAGCRTVAISSGYLAARWLKIV